MEETLQKWLYDPVIGKLIAALVALSVLYVLIRFIQRSISRYVKESTVRYRIRKFLSFLGYFLGVVLIGTIFSERLSGLTVAFGVAGAGIAFALQEVIASVAGWVAITFGQFYSPGDRVQLGGIKGDVIDIGILRTTLMECGQWVSGDNYNGRIVRISNSFIFKEPVFNYSADFPFLWDEIVLPVRYGSDWEFARQVFTRIVNEICAEYALQSKEAWKSTVMKYRLEDARIEPSVTLAANDNWIEFTVCYIVDYRKRKFVKNQLYTRILEEIGQSRGRIRLASATFEVTDIPPLEFHYADGKGKVDPE